MNSSECDPCDNCNPSFPGSITVETNNKCSPLYSTETLYLNQSFLEEIINNLTGFSAGIYTLFDVDVDSGISLITDLLSAILPVGVQLTANQLITLTNSLVASLSVYELSAPDITLIFTIGNIKITICIKWNVVLPYPPLEPPISETPISETPIRG